MQSILYILYIQYPAAHLVQTPHIRRALTTKTTVVFRFFHKWIDSIARGCGTFGVSYFHWFLPVRSLSLKRRDRSVASIQLSVISKEAWWRGGRSRGYPGSSSLPVSSSAACDEHAWNGGGDARLVPGGGRGRPDAALRHGGADVRAPCVLPPLPRSPCLSSSRSSALTLSR